MVLDHAGVQHSLRAVIAAIVFLAAACGGSGDSATQPTPTGAPQPTATVDATPSAAPAPTATPDPCDPTTIFAVADQTISSGRVAEGQGPWITPAPDTTFSERTRDPASFASVNGLDCSVLAAQDGPGDSDRLLLASWTGDRYAMVIQLVDAPSTPYAPDQLFDFLSEQTFAEAVQPDLWAATMQGGETLLLRVSGYSSGATAKTWQSEFDVPPPGETTNAAQRYAIAALEAADARNIGIAEPAPIGSELASVAFQAPGGAVMIATVGPVGLFDADFTSLSGQQRSDTISGVDVFITEPGPDDFAGAEVGFDCLAAAYVWRLELGFGDTAELLDWAGQLLETIGCAG